MQHNHMSTAAQHRPLVSCKRSSSRYGQPETRLGMDNTVEVNHARQPHSEQSSQKYNRIPIYGNSKNRLAFSILSKGILAVGMMTQRPEQVHAVVCFYLPIGSLPILAHIFSSPSSSSDRLSSLLTFWKGAMSPANASARSCTTASFIIRDLLIKVAR